MSSSKHPLSTNPLAIAARKRRAKLRHLLQEGGDPVAASQIAAMTTRNQEQMRHTRLERLQQSQDGNPVAATQIAAITTQNREQTRSTTSCLRNLMILHTPSILLNSCTLWTHQASHHIASLWKKACWLCCSETYQVHSAMAPDLLFAISHVPSLSVTFLPLLKLWTYHEFPSYHLKVICRSSSNDGSFQSDQHMQWRSTRVKVKHCEELAFSCHKGYLHMASFMLLSHEFATHMIFSYLLVVILCTTLFIRRYWYQDCALIVINKIKQFHSYAFRQSKLEISINLSRFTFCSTDATCTHYILTICPLLYALLGVLPVD
jgi:hypothetical protein